MIVNMMNLAKASVVIPAAVSSFWLVTPAKSYMSGTSSHADASFEIPIPTSLDQANDSTGSESGMTQEAGYESSKDVAVDEMTSVRRMRIENILAVLNRVAEVSLQMEPERAAQLEPVILDLAEQAMALSQKEVVVKASTGRDLDHIEKVVRRLSHAVANSIEPEMQL